MKHGLFTMLVFGTTAVPKFENDPEGEAFVAWFEALNEIALDLNYPYAAEPEYVGIRLAVDDEFFQDYWELPPLPCASLRCAVGPRQVVPAKVVKLPRAVSERLRAARSLWEKMRTASKESGHVLGPGKLLLVSDWD